ncbi:PD-(D/E)XK nuclease family protein [Planctomicrobium sp. SH668]|uniref:PD-(D/E)XK nuclease family protein n=1 Tax=Planctomicrobium sp. SH668 TaxID=3448126 RepID=UPI003F5BA16B
MPIQRIFLDWSQPTLEVVTDQLLLRNRNSRFIDLSHLVLVFNGRQAGRRCQELLAEKSGGILAPPRVVTAGQLPELLYEPKRPFAALLVQQLAWAEALRSQPAEKLRNLTSIAPNIDDHAGWVRLGELLRRQHDELARDQIDFSDVWKRGSQLPDFNETNRWKFLEKIQQDYLKLLDQFGIWDQQTARLEAIKRKECRTDKEIVTIGTVDLSRTVRAMLSQIADRVTAYIPASEAHKDDFDEFGCILPERWIDQTVEIDDEKLIIADDTAGQCAAVLGILNSYQGKFSVDEITIGVPDQALVQPIQRALEEHGIPSHWPVDREVSSTGPYRLLDVVANFLEEPRAEYFAALIRHPDVGIWLRTKHLPANWLSDWDQYFSSHLPRMIDWILDDTHSASVIKLKKAIQELVSPFPRKKASLTQWARPIRQLLDSVYEHSEFNPDDPNDKQLNTVIELLKDGFSAQHRIPELLDIEMSANEAIRLILKNSSIELFRGETESAVQIVGWLEMPLDDAPATIVTTFNETFVPKSVNHDLFLPNRLRTHLGIEDNTRRYARDLYLLTSLVRSRKNLHLIVSRRNTNQDPLTPSRLLFATSPERIANRVLRFYEPEHQSQLPIPVTPLQIGTESGFRIPMPSPVEAPKETFRVTEFRDYLASPYRYYLRHILKLESVSDEIDELDGAAFGTLVHEVLSRFGNSSRRNSRDPEVIAEFLSQELLVVVEECYGKEPLAAILIQAEQAKRRLMAFAYWQAKWRLEGWEIFAVEQANEEPVRFNLRDGRAIFLRGRIDRIDHHPESGKWAIFDYKTGDRGASPEQTHRWQNEWVDLQLPLYRHLASEITGLEDVQLGYIVLPRDVGAVNAVFAQWTDEDLIHADETARDVAIQILDQHFWKPLPEPSGTMTEFDVICQTGVFGQEISL